MTKSRDRDQFLYLALAVVFAAVAVIWVKSLSGGGMIRNPAEIRVENGKQTVEAESPAGMMLQLQMTTDDGGAADLEQIKSEASGL